MALQIRPARPHELAEAGRLCVDAYVAAGHLDPADGYAATLADAAARARSAEVLVAVEDDSIVGTVTICPAGTPYSEIARPGEAEFRFLAVAPDRWGGGIGDILVRACEERARGRGERAQVICVVDANAGAMRFYERLGFARLPDRDWSPRPGVRLLAFRRPVAPDAPRPAEPGAAQGAD